MKKVNLKTYGFDKTYMEKNLIDDKIYQIINQFNWKKVTVTKFCSLPLNEIYNFIMEMVERERFCMLMTIK